MSIFSRVFWSFAVVSMMGVCDLDLTMAVLLVLLISGVELAMPISFGVFWYFAILVTLVTLALDLMTVAVLLVLVVSAVDLSHPAAFFGLF